MGEYTNSPAHFPHVSIEERDNYVSQLDSSDNEHHAVVTYEINVYTNKQEGKKSQCKSIIKTIDDIMYSLNFRRLALTPVPNLNDASIYRITARYRAETDGNNIYRR